MKRLRVGIVGVGRWGSLHVEKYASIPEVEIAGIADKDEEKAGAIAKKFGVKAFRSHTDLIGKIDAASVTVPTVFHRDVALDLLNSGVHLLVEKPIAQSLKEADDIIGLAAKKGCILQVGHLERFNSAVSSLEGKVNNPLFIECHRLGPFTARGTDVDVVLDLMIHDLDIISNWAGKNVVFVHAVGLPVITDKVDIANARIEFAGGCVANITASRISAEKTRKIRIFQPDAYISINYDERRISIFRRTFDSGTPQISGENIDLQVTDSLKDEIRSFVKSVSDGLQPKVTGEDGKAALNLAEMILSSIESHKNKVEQKLSVKV